MNSMRRAGMLALVGLMTLASAPVRSAELDFGVRAGITSDPDDFHFGGHLRMNELFNQVHALVLETAATVGFGDTDLVDYWAIRINGNLEYEFVVSDSGIMLFPLAGLGIYYLNVDDCNDDLFFDCDETELGLNLGGGVRYRHLALEMVLGLGDLPDFALTGSYTF